jgi:hypothetical protein
MTILSFLSPFTLLSSSAQRHNVAVLGNSSCVTERLSIRLYSTGAERLWYRVSWERAIGNVIVVDPFDPGSLLYMPAPQYQDLLKTALANRTPLVVVHGLADEIPLEGEYTENKTTYRTFSLQGKEIVSARHIKNTPQQPLRPLERFLSVVRTTLYLRSSGMLPEESRRWFHLLPDILRSEVKIRERFPAEPRNMRVARHPLDGRAPFDQKVESPKAYKDRQSSTLEATTAARLAWAGATLISRSGRALGWTATVFRFFLHIWQHNSLKVAAATFAEGRRLVYKVVAGTPEQSSVSPLSVGLKDGLPTFLPRGLRFYVLKGDVTAIRLALFLLSICDLFKYNAVAKTSTILDPYTGPTALSGDFEQEVRRAARSLRDQYGSVPMPRWKGLHMTVKSGPFGTALASAPLDAWAMVASPSWEYFQSFCHAIGAHKLVDRLTWMAWVTRRLVEMMGTISDAVIDLPHNVRNGRFTRLIKESRMPWTHQLSRLIGILPTGKIAQKIEPRGKVRIFAIPGYWTQTVLRGLHDSLFEYFKKLPHDCTFDQLAGITRVTESGSQKIWSYDLSAATDRFPLEIQEWVLSELIESRTPAHAAALAKAWAGLLRSLTFSYKRTRNSVEYLSYGTGQPMGAYSSWAAFSLAHHVMVRVAAIRAGLSETGNYELLGDDIILHGDEPCDQLVASEYRDLMISIGVGINPIKGLESSNGTFEFAKRLVRNGVTYTGLKWKELARVQQWTDVVTVLTRFLGYSGYLPQIRTALEVGFVLVRGIPVPRPLHQLASATMRRLVSRRAIFGNLFLQLVGPTGPYRTSFVGWLSETSFWKIDFHPNVGHFVPMTGQFLFIGCPKRPIVHTIEQLRSELASRVISGNSSVTSLLNSLLRVVPTLTKTPQGRESIVVNDMISTVVLDQMGWLKAAVKASPAYWVTYRALLDLLKVNTLNFPASWLYSLHPDNWLSSGTTNNYRQWIGDPKVRATSTPWYGRILSEVQPIVQEWTESYLPIDDSWGATKTAAILDLGTFIRQSVTDLLPCALPNHDDSSSQEELTRAVGRVVVRSWDTFFALTKDAAAAVDQVIQATPKGDVDLGIEFPSAVEDPFRSSIRKFPMEYSVLAQPLSFLYSNEFRKLETNPIPPSEIAPGISDSAQPPAWKAVCKGGKSMLGVRLMSRPPAPGEAPWVRPELRPTVLVSGDDVVPD